MVRSAQKSMNPHVVLLDAHAIIHRAYHALPDFSSSKGEPTGALYGLSSMLIKIIQDLKPDYIAACVDLPEPTLRHQVYEAYKGTRHKTDDALVAQLKRAPEVFKAFGIPVFAAAGFEADDCLGTIVRQLKKKPLRITIASGDMDTLQLVAGNTVTVFTLRKGLNDTILYTEDAVKERFGFGPEYIPDYKALRGDPSDNIKGVRGIGEKAATELIQKFGGVHDIYKVLKKNKALFAERGIKPRTVALLEESEDDALFSLMLATIRHDAPITYTVPEHLWRESVSIEAAHALFDALEFKTLGARLTSLVKGTTEPIVRPADPEINSTLSKEAGILLWLLHSDMTNPSYDDVLRVTGAHSLTAAHAALLREVKATGKLYDVFETIERPLIPVVERMHQYGVSVDVSYLKKLSHEYKSELRSIEKRIHTHAGKVFNINSPTQLGVVLFEDLHLAQKRQKKTATGKLSTKESELEKLRDSHPVIDDILAYRELAKLLSTYVDALPKLVAEDGRLHTEFLQTGTTTGRMASQNPNMQNIPIRSEYGQRIRNAFVAAPGYTLVALDYSQIELRIAAGLSGDEKLIDIFKKGGDVHRAVAAEVFNVPPELVDKEMRRRAKIINFGILYGMGVQALRQNLGESISREEAAQFLADYFADFSGLARYLEHTKVRAAQDGYTETLFGRRRLFSGFTSHLPYIRAQAERMALNAPIQGTQADVIKRAMVVVHEWVEKRGLAKEVKMLLQVHDELVFEIRSEKVEEYTREIKHIMEQVVPDSMLHGIPLTAESACGDTWGTLVRM